MFRIAWILATLLCLPTLIETGLWLPWLVLSILLAAEPAMTKSPEPKPGAIARKGSR